MLILLYVQQETSWDKQWFDADRIYRINTTMDLPGREPYRISRSSALLAPALTEHFGEQIELAARARLLEADVVQGSELLKKNVVAVDPEFIDI
ncbi:MAG: hypothetical protein V4603_18745, partial [Pseudomonadota bacterium]